MPALSHANFRTEAHSRAYGPQREVRIATPTVRWEVWPGDGSHVTDVRMTLNGREVRARYDTRARHIAYTPSEPLPSGKYEVACKVTVDDLLPVRREWSFRISDDALRTLPAISSEQHRVIDEINGLRSLVGLESLQPDARLCAAAAAHSKYLRLNNLMGHDQRRGDDGFVGSTPGDRLNAFGFADDSWEGVDSGSRSPSDAIRRLFDAPYHRLPFLQPGPAMVGAGFTEGRMTLEFEMTHPEGTVMSPADGQHSVPTSWFGRERPDPLQVHGLKAPVGYPIVFAHFSPTDERIRVRSAELKTAWGKKVPFVLNTPANDSELEFSAILIPRQPLATETGYDVTVVATTESGRDISRSWRFVTE